MAGTISPFHAVNIIAGRSTNISSFFETMTHNLDDHRNRENIVRLMKSPVETMDEK